MRLELDKDNKVVSSDISGIDQNDSKTIKQSDERTGVRDEIKEQTAKFSELSLKKKIEYVWDYYKWYIIVGLAVMVFGTIFVRDYKDNLRPTYITVEMLNSYFAYDTTNTVSDDFINQYNIDTNEYKLYINTGMNLAEQGFDTTMLANQQKLVSMYTAQDLDVVIGPVQTIEGAANCDCYGNLNEILPKDLIDELVDREYEFYYFDPSKDEIEDYEERQPYFAGVYLDNCSYLNNNGEYGAYAVPETEEERAVFTIAANSLRQDHAIEFLRFLIENR